MSVGIKVFAPASVANVCVGFDMLGFALDAPGDEIIAKLADRKRGLRITKITGAKGKLPYEVEKNTAGVAALRLLQHLGESERGIDLEIHKKMPFSSGLGSSAASAVAGAMAINEILKRPLTKRALLPFAIKGEQLASGALHADNVAPSLIGGMILIRSNQELDVHRMIIPKGLRVAVLYPKIEIQTKSARSILSDTVSLKQTIQQCGNLGGFILGMVNSDLDLIKRSLNDVLIEHQRASLIPSFYDVKEAALNEGALGCSISGAGPAMFALCPNSLVAEKAGEAMQKVFAKNKIESTLFLSSINQEGAKLL